ncbi:hypothetical protein ACFWUW_22060 [Streptomyces sp. NPDC058655]|uniref:hypothetical protein n=1 Tax=Streptomyces sp. NPDC058655 TaxID=3346577 RepID=UPI00364D505A
MFGLGEEPAGEGPQGSAVAVGVVAAHVYGNNGSDARRIEVDDVHNRLRAPSPGAVVSTERLRAAAIEQFTDPGVVDASRWWLVEQDQQWGRP